MCIPHVFQLRAEKDRFAELQHQLQQERDAALRQVHDEVPAPRPPLPDPELLWQMRQQATESEQQRRTLERARCDVVRQATIIAKEKENLEREVGHVISFYNVYLHDLLE